MGATGSLGEGDLERAEQHARWATEHKHLFE